MTSVSEVYDAFFGLIVDDWYMEITEEAARIMKESGSDEIVYYSKELDMYIWGITHYGTSWKLMLTSIPIPEDNAA